MDPGFGNRSDILLAYDERNDDVAGSDYASLATVGPRLIVPGDVKGGRYVSCVRDVRLASSEDSNGSVPGPPRPARRSGRSHRRRGVGSRCDRRSGPAAGCSRGDPRDRRDRPEGRRGRGRTRRQGDVQEQR